MRMRGIASAAICAAVLTMQSATPSAAEGHGDRPGVDPGVEERAAGEPTYSRAGLAEYGVKVGGGHSLREGVDIYPLYVHAAWYLPNVIDAPLRRRNLHLKYLVEGWVAGGTGPQDFIDFGANPIGFKFDYDAGQNFVPYFQAAIGAMYTGLGGIGLGGPFEFNETVTFGFEYFIDTTTAVDLGFRYRHISNAGIKGANLGLDTFFGMIGLTFHPERTVRP